MTHRRNHLIKLVKLSVAATLGIATATAGLVIPALAQAQGLAPKTPAAVTLLNVSYDPTRELYVEFKSLQAK